ncbi:MAG TPA: adenosine monophosphate-protein transferase [Archaeoglobus veneficus]|nr:adenosine monophosphate-protein transferase [Archaeoglobus veneficus]
MMKLEVVKIENPDLKYQIVVGQGNFAVFTCDDLFRALLTAVPNIKCAVAMNEAAPKLVRVTGNDGELKNLAAKNALAIGASHVFVVVTSNAFPINMLNTIKMHPAVCNVFVASANPIEIIVAETELGRAVLGAVDGSAVNRIESDKEKEERRELVEKLGYRLD